MCSINLPTATPAEKIVSAAATAPKISKAIIIAEPSFPWIPISVFYVIRGVLSASDACSAPTGAKRRTQSLRQRANRRV